MVKLNKIYTKNGDQGQTYLANAQKVSKTDLHLDAYGLIDQLIVEIGSALVEISASNIDFTKEIANLESIQNRLFDLGAQLARTKNTDIYINKDDVQAIENLIDHYCAVLPELDSFVLPGKSKTNVILHSSRVICRNAERACWKLNEQEKLSQDLLIFLNRLSDYLFVLSRHVIHKENKQEVLWKPGLKINNN